MNTEGIKQFFSIIFMASLIYGCIYIATSPDQKENVRFCNEQGWAYSSGDGKDRTEIWCGVMTYDDENGYGFQGVTYQVEKKFFGGYKVKEGFDVNKELKKNRFREYCMDLCENQSSHYDEIHFEQLECVCFNLSNYTEFIIKPNYVDILIG